MKNIVKISSDSGPDIKKKKNIGNVCLLMFKYK